MEDEESERQRKLKAGREKLLQFQQKKSGGKKKKKAGSKSSKSKIEGDSVQQHSGEFGGNSVANSEHDVSIASADTEQDVSSITSEVEEQIAHKQQEPQLFAQSGGESTGGSYVSENYTSGEESFASEDVGGVDDLVIANLERNELKHRTVELEEELVAKKAALKEISKENAELKAKLENIAGGRSEDGHANERINRLESMVSEKDLTLQELQKENWFLKKRIEESQDLDRSESSQVEELRGKLTTKQVTLDELNKQNEELSNQVQNLQVQLSNISKDDINTIMENLKVKEDSVQQLSMENENQRSVIKSLEEGITKSNLQLTECHQQLQLRDQKLQQVANSWKDYLAHNLAMFKEQLAEKDQQLNIATQEVSKLQQMLSERDASADITSALEEKNSELEDMKNQVAHMENKLKHGDDEVVLLKSHIQGQTEQLITLQQTLDNANAMHNENDNKIVTLQKQLDLLTQSNEDMSDNSAKTAEQMTELCNALDERDQRISHLELNLSDVAEEKELLKSEMANQTQELVNQVKDLRAKLEESNNKVQEQSDEMENSFSELHVTKDMIQDLQKEMLEKDLALDNTSQKLHNTEEILEQIQKKFVEEKERLQNELNEKDEIMEESRTLLSEELQKEKSSGAESLEKIDVLTNEMAAKDKTIEDFTQRLDEAKQRHHEEMESLKLELEYLKEGASDSGKRIVEISEKYQEQIWQLQESGRRALKEGENRVLGLNEEVKQRDILIANAKTEQTEAQENHDKEVLELQSVIEKQQQQLTESKDALREAQREHQNEMEMLKSSHTEEIVNLKYELDQCRSSSLSEQTRLQGQIVQAQNEHEQEIILINEINNELKEKLKAAQQKDDNSLKEQLKHQEEEREKIRKLYESLVQEKEELLAEHIKIKNELDKHLTLQSNNEKDVDQLHQRIETLEDDLARLQDSEERLLKEKADYVNLLQETKGGHEQNVVVSAENLQRAEQEGGREVRLLRDELSQAKEIMRAENNQARELLIASEEKVNMLEKKIHELQESQASTFEEKQHAMELLQETEGKINEVKKEEDKVQQLESEMQELLRNHDVAVTKLQETEILLSRSDSERQETAQTHENKMRELYEEIQENKEQFLAQQQETAGLLKKAEEQLAKRTEVYEIEIRKLNEKLQELQDNRSATEQQAELSEKCIRYENENKLLQDRMMELEKSQAKFVLEKEELQNMLNKTQAELVETQAGHENEIKQMDEQLEQTRQVVESIKADKDSNVVNLQESYRLSEEELQRKLQEKENEYEELVQGMQNEHEDVRSQLEKSKIDNDDLQKQLKTLVSEKEEWKIGKEKDWNSNSFEQQPVIQETVLSSENWMDVQGETDDGWDWSVPDEDIPGDPKKISTPQQAPSNELESLERIAYLQEKLAEKEKSEIQLVEEKNKLLKIVKEYNESLTTERDFLKERIFDQDETIKNLQEQLSMSELVSSDLQQVFAQQLLVLEKQRDSLLNQLDEQQKERSSFVDVLEEKHALEENLRSEKEQLAEKLRQTDVLEKQLDDERVALQEQLIRQAKLNEIIREKDLLEKELTEQKNRLQLELSAIEESLHSKEQLLEREKEALREELLDKENEIETWQGELKTKEEKERAERELLEKNFTATLLSTRTELEDTYQQNLEHLRTELEESLKQRLFEVEDDFQAHHKQEIASLSRQHEQQVSGVKTEYEEKIKNLKRMLEEQRQRQVTTMKSVLERDRENEVQHLMDNHDSDMEKLRNELNLRHQDIVNAVVARLKRTHQQDMEECLASAVTDTVLKVEVARLEVEKEYETKFNELRENSEVEIEKLKELNEEEVSKLKAQYKEEVERREMLEKQHGEDNEELRVRYEEDMKKQLTAVQEELNRENDEKIEKMREDIEEEYENQIETLQDELEEKYEKDLRELREELDKQGHEITASAIEELQRKHFLEINALKEEHEQIYAQMLSAREKEENDLKEDMRVVATKLDEEKDRVKQMSLRMEEILKESKEEEAENVSSLQTAMDQKVTFLEHEHEQKIADIHNELEAKLKAKEDELNEQLRSLRSEFEKEKMEMELKYLSEVRELCNNNNKKLSDKEQQHIADITKLQQKLALVREENEDNTFREVEESRQQLSEKFENDLEAIVRDLKLQHQKEIDHLIAEAEANQSNAERDVFDTWKTAIIDKHEKEIRELRNEHQKELEANRATLEKEKSEELERISSSLSTKSAKELKELQTRLTTEFEEELKKEKIEHQNIFDTEIDKLVTKYMSLREQHEATVRELDNRLNSTIAEQIEPLNNEIRVCKDVIQEKEMEIENLKREHEKDLKELKQRSFDDLLEEVSEVRADLALDAAREVEIAKIGADYEVAKKVKELQDVHSKEIAEQTEKAESLERDKKTLEELLRSHAEETRELQENMEKEKNELKRIHDEEVQDLKTRLDVEQQNALNELKGKLMKEMDEMEEMRKNMSEEERKELKENFSQREAEIKENEGRIREEMLKELKAEQEKQNEEIKENVNKEHLVAMQELQDKYEREIKKIEDKFAAEMQTVITEKDKALRQANEQHHRELESTKQELVQTHMEKFTLMTEELDKSHQEELQTRLKEAEEIARYNLEKEHLESLKKLEEDLQKKHEGQLSALNDLVEQHRAQIKKLSEEHGVETQEVEQNWQKKLADELNALKNEQREEMIEKENLLQKAETEMRRALLEIETKDKNISELTAFIEKASGEYEERLAKIRKEFEEKLDEMKNDSSYEEQLRGVQELLAKQHAEELERLRAEHDQHMEVARNELEGERALKTRIKEELEEKLSEHLAITTEKEHVLKARVKEMENEIADLKERSNVAEKALEEKEKELNELQEQKQAVDMDVLTLEGNIRDIENREERQQRENANLIQMLRADLDAINSERDSIERAKAKLIRQLTTAVKTTMAIEDTITSRLETLFEQTLREDDDETVSEVASLPEAEDSIPEGFRRQAAGMLASSTPAAPAGARALDDSDETERTVMEEKQVDMSQLSDEGLEVSVILSDNQGSLDVQNDETVVDSGNRLRAAVKKLLDIVASVSRQLNDARKTQDELLNTTSQRTEELNQLTQAQNALMLRLQEEIEAKEQVTNRVRNAEEEMEIHIANVEKLENLLTEKENERLRLEESLLEERNVETQREIQELLREKEEFQKGVESLKSKSEEMEKAYEKEKELLCDKITELQNKVKESESQLRLHLSEDSYSGVSLEHAEALPEEKPATPQTDQLKEKIQSLQQDIEVKENENIQLKKVREELNSKLSILTENKVKLEKEARDNQDSYEQEIERLRGRQEQGKHEIHGNEELLKDNESLKKEINTLKISVKSLTNDLQNISQERDNVQSAFQEAEVAWEEEKNSLQQQLYDSCLEASSFKDRFNKVKQEAENVAELQDKLLEQNEAYTKLEANASNMESEISNLKKSLSEKENEVETLSASVRELKEGLLTQQNILEEHHMKLIQAENDKVMDEDEIRKLKDALEEAESSVEESEAKMQEVLKNMKNLESTYKAQTIEATQQLNQKVDALQKELREITMKLNQEKQRNSVIRNHIDDLKQQHIEELMSCKSQFETDIKEALERAKWRQTVDDEVEEPTQTFLIEQQSYESEPDSNVESRLNNELKNVDGFTKTIAGYLSEMKHENLNEDEDLDTSTTKKIETVLDDLRIDSDAVYSLVNSLPALHDPKIKSLQNVWKEEQEILRKAIEFLHEETVSKLDEMTVGKDWRGVIVSAALDVLKKEENMLSSELETIDLAANNDGVSILNLIRRRQQKQDDLHRQSVGKLYEADRISLLSEINELEKSLTAVKQELTNENHKLQEQLQAIQNQVRKREKELLQQVTTKEELLQKERELLDNIQTERKLETKQLNEANDLLTRQRNVTNELQAILTKNKTRLKELESALEKERTQNTVTQTCLDSEKARSSNLEQALKHERLNVESRERELEKKSQLLQELSDREEETIKDLEEEVLRGKQQLSELETKRREEKTRIKKMETELAEKQTTSAFDTDKLKNLINDLRQELEKAKNEKVELLSSLNEERKISEDLKLDLESLPCVKVQIGEQEQLITDLSEALEKERRVNEELRNALDNDYDDTDKTDDRQVNVVKELKMSLTAVQEQLRNQIDVVDQERSRVKRLRKERDIHEASALGARTKERNLERELKKEQAAREMEVGNLKDMLEHETALKRNLEEVLRAKNSEFETVSQELQFLKDDRRTIKTPPSSPSRDRLNILRHDLKSIIDEHRVFLIMHKEYLEKQLKVSHDSPELSGLYSQIQNLSYEMDRIKKQVGAVSEVKQSMTDTKTSESKNKNVKESDLSGDNVGNTDSEDIDAESGIGTVNEYDSVVIEKNTKIVSIPKTRGRNNEVIALHYDEEFNNQMNRRKASTNMETSRRYTESDLRSRSLEQIAGQRRHTLAGDKRENIEENYHETESNLSASPSKEKKEISENFKPHASRRFTDGGLFNPTMQTNADQRRHTFAGNRLENIDNDNYLAEKCTYRLSRSLSDTEIGVNFKKSDALFPPQTNDISRRNTIAGDNIEKSAERENNNSLRAKRHTIAGTRVGKSIVMPVEVDFSYLTPGTQDDGSISTSEDEQNLRRFHGPHKALKRHTYAETAREYHSGIPSKYSFAIDDLDPSITPGYSQRNVPTSATFKRHTIAGTSHQGMDTMIDKGELRTFQNLPRSPERQTENERMLVGGGSVHHGDGYVPATIRKRSLPGQEYIHDVILDEGIRIDHRPRELSPLRRHTVDTGRQQVVDVATKSFIPELQTRRQGHEFTLQDDFNDEQSHGPRKSLTRRNTGTVISVSPEPGQAGVVYGRINSVYEHPYKHFVEDRQNFQGNARLIRQNNHVNSDVYPREDEQYYISKDRETDGIGHSQTRHNSILYTLSNNVLHVHKDGAPRETDIIEKNSNLTHGETKIQREEAAIHEQSADSNSRISNCIAVGRSVMPLPDSKPSDGGVQIPGGNILLRGQDSRGNKLKFNLSVIEEETGEENYRKLEETPTDNISNGQLIHKCNYQKPPKDPHKKCLCNFNRSLQYREASELSCLKCNVCGSVKIKQRESIISGNEQNIHEYGTKDKIVDSNKKSVLEHRLINKVLDESLSKEKTDQRKANVDTTANKLSKSQVKKTDSRSQTAGETSASQFCSLHGKHEPNHPICCWHLKNSLCDECKMKQRRKSVGKPQDIMGTIEATQSDMKSSDFSHETSNSSESLVEAAGFDDHANETKYIGSCEPKQTCLNCIHELQEKGNESKGLGFCARCAGGLKIIAKDNHESQAFETRTENNDKIQSKLQEPKRDTSSDRGEYQTAQETSISEDDYNDIKLYSYDDSSGVHRKAYKNRRHRKSHKARFKRKSCLEEEMGSPIRLSPIKAATYDRIVKQNKEMSDYLAKLTDEKSELRSTLCHLELQISQYRDREADHLENMRRNKREMETMLTNERTRAAQDLLTLHQTIEGQKKKVNELQDIIRERETEVDETKRSLQVMEDQVERHKVSAKRFQSSESVVAHWTPARIQKLYARYIRAEKSRKSLVYQKKYLVLLLGGFRENETRTLAMIAKMGAYPSYHETTSRFSPAFTKFRTAVRVVVATKRMQFLVEKSKKAVRQIVEPVESKSNSQRSTHSSTKAVYNNRQHEPYKPNYRNTHQTVPSRVEVDNVSGSQQGDISMDPKDTSFAEIYTGSIDTAVPKHTDSGVYSAFDYKPNEVVTGLGKRYPEITTRLEPRHIQTMAHSPPVRERRDTQRSQYSSIPPSFSTYPYQTETRHDVRSALHFDSDDLDRKIKKLDNLQHKLSLNRGGKDKT